MTQSNKNTYLSPVLGKFHDLDIQSGHGCYLTDATGTDYLDFGAGIAVASTGHCHPAVVQAIQDQAATLIHPCIAMGTYPSLLSCAERLCSIVGPEPYSLFFDQTGTGAVEAALKLAKFVTGKHKIVAFQGGFHGRSMGSLSVTSSKKSYRDNIGPMLEGVSFFPYPYCYRCPWNDDIQSCQTEACINALHTSDLFSSDVAAVIIEPILGEGGYVPAPHAFLRELEALCKEKNILLIIDEIQSGIGRTGHWFAFQEAGLSPDIVVTAKGLGSGMPIAACIAKKHIMDKWKAGAHGGTYGGNPVTCAAALATLDIIEKEKKRVPALAARATEQLTAGLSEHPFIGDIRIAGLMIGIECVTDKAQKTPHPELTSYILKECLKRNLIVLSCGIHHNVIRLAPPLIISDEELQTGLQTLIEVIHDYH